MPAPRPASDRQIVLRLPRHTLKIAGIAFGAGLLLFLLVWATGRKDDFYKAAPAPPSASAPTDAQAIQPLPAPLPAQDGASDMPQAKPPEDTPALVETAPPPPPAPAPLPEDAVAGAPGTPTAAPVAGGHRPVPMQGQMPPPRYPSAALRRGDAGEVVVRVDVDAAGNPGGVTLVQRSGSRDLDRAAMEAVRHWRFHPAQNSGQPVAGSLDVPFQFKPAQ
ncbi:MULTISPECIES: energy transducer TonB [Xanthomonas]|nr:energy transducer TonB [Xanthomonas cucurbitae]WDM69119.1 energy transducer TonB [Xanthomonas cucurbitae]WDM72990.1 energy transducer TonB [Xanthomonas cucurbitae]WDM76699.1 energy transducer TonB [Xanthomonas cucurbitae]WDM77854.1 energy transducer TonB [Xanthomonas cucurbitae]WDM81531.1 energy transducer TonB [Xanthomonas cucurbitae]